MSTRDQEAAASTTGRSCGVRTTGDAPAATTGDPRTVRTDHKIIAGALRLLREGGPQRVTIEAVSAATGVAKTSIYRRYDNSPQLLEAALQHTAAASVPVAQDASWEQALAEAVDLLLRDLGVGVAITLLQEPGSPTAEVLRSAVLRPRMDVLRTLLQRDQDRGTIRASVDLEMVVDFLLGAAYAHIARCGSLDEEWIERVHRAVTDLTGAREAES